jgi:hypothetical protein
MSLGSRTAAPVRRRFSISGITWNHHRHAGHCYSYCTSLSHNSCIKRNYHLSLTPCAIIRRTVQTAPGCKNAVKARHTKPLAVQTFGTTPSHGSMQLSRFDPSITSRAITNNPNPKSSRCVAYYVHPGSRPRPQRKRPTLRRSAQALRQAARAVAARNAGCGRCTGAAGSAWSSKPARGLVLQVVIDERKLAL